MTATLFKTLLFTVLVPGSVVILIPRWILGGAVRLAGGVTGTLGATIFCVGLVLYLRCAWDFATVGRGTPAIVDPPRELVVSGLYRHLRNPMYLGVLSLVLGQAVLSGSRALLRYSALLFIVFHLFVVFYEEPQLRSRFGDSYLRYCTAVRRWLPRLRPWSPGSGVALPRS